MRTFILCLLLLPVAAFARDWNVDMAKSGLGFDGIYQGGAFAGKFAKWTATISYDETDLAHAKFNVTVQLASVDTGSGERDQTLATSEFFDTAKFPRASFQSSAMKDLGGGRYEIAGNLTLKGTTRPVVIPVQLRRDAAGNSVAEGQFAVKRLQFNVGDGPWADPSVVADDVLVRVRMVLPRAA